MVAPMIIASGVQAALGAYGAIRGSKSAKAAKKEGRRCASEENGKPRSNIRLSKTTLQ